MSSISQRTAAASIWTVAGKFLARLLDFISLLVLARLLSPADFGLVAVATAVIVIVEAVLDIPLVQALVRQPSPSERMFATAFTLGVLRGSAILLVMAIVAWPMMLFYDDPRLYSLVVVLSLAPAMRSMISPRMVIFMQQFDFRREFCLDLLAKTSTLLAAVGVSLATGSYWGLAIGAVAGQFAAMTISYIFAPMRPAFTLSEWRLFQDMIGWNTIAQILDSTNWQLDRLLLGRFTGLTISGTFSVADSIASIPHQTFVGPLMRPLMAAFTSVQGHRQRAAAYLKATGAATLVAAPVLLTLIMFAEPVIRLVVGQKWIAAAPILQMLCLVSLVGLPSTVMPPLVMVMDKTRYVALRMFVEFLVRAPVTIAGIIYFGVAGALGGRLIAVLVAYATSLFIVRRLIGPPMVSQLMAFLRPLAAGLPMMGLMLLVKPYLIAIPTGWSLAFGLCVCAGASLAVFWISALCIWLLAGRPDGLEAIVFARILPAGNAARRLLRMQVGNLHSGLSGSFKIVKQLVLVCTLAGGLGSASSNAQVPLDLNDFEITFQEDFDKLDVSAWGEGGTRWIAHTPWNGDFGDARFTDPGPDFPFRTISGILQIEARKDDEGVWRSGLLASTNPKGEGFSQQFGYFEARMKLPPGKGVWPAFWLIGVDRSSYTAEIDVIEYYGRVPWEFSSGYHVWRQAQGGQNTSDGHWTTVENGVLNNDFHTYGVEVMPERTTFYLDRKPIWSFDTPPEFHMPFFPLVNLALGSGWPIDETPNPSFLLVDYIHVYKRKPAHADD